MKNFSLICDLEPLSEVWNHATGPFKVQSHHNHQCKRNVPTDLEHLGCDRDRFCYISLPHLLLILDSETSGQTQTNRTSNHSHFNQVWSVQELNFTLYLKKQERIVLFMEKVILKSMLWESAVHVQPFCGGALKQRVSFFKVHVN